MKQPTMIDELAAGPDARQYEQLLAMEHETIRHMAYAGIRRHAFALWVGGDPQGKGSVMALPVKRANGKVGARVVMKGSKAKRAWDQTIKDRSREYVREMGVADGQPMFGEHMPLRLEVTFWMPKPQRIPMGGKNGRKHPGAAKYPSVFPDLDKLLRLLKDALKGSAYFDDAQVVTTLVKKRYPLTGELVTGDEPGVFVTIDEETGD